MGVVVVVDDLDVDRSCDVSRNGVSVGRGTDGFRSPGNADATGPRLPSEPAASGERGSLPVPGLLGLSGSAGFAVWTSLTCFVC